MLKQTSKGFRRFFLLEFTKELIRNSGAVFELKSRIEKEVKQRIELPKKNIGKELISLQKYSQLPKLQISPTKIKSPMPVLRIPEPKLPLRLQYLRPIPTITEIDFGKLNPLIRDPNVQVIECNGPNEKLLVRGAMGTKTSNIMLTKEEINNTIEKISKETKIPVEEGIFRAAVGRIIFLAIISKIIGSKFIIKKMISNLRSPIQRRVIPIT